MKNEAIHEDLKRLQQKELEIMLCVTDCLEKNAFPYYAVGGTLLGAVRHKGFIPWDDDVDIAMPRVAYEEFAQKANDMLPPHLKVVYDDLVMTYKVVDSGTKILINSKTCPEEMQVFLDILPIDAGAKTLLGTKWQMTRYLLARFAFKATYIDRITENDSRSRLDNLLIKFCKIVPLNKLFNRQKALNRMDRIAKTYSWDTSNYTTILAGRYRYKDIFPKSIWGNGQQGEFEKNAIMLPANYDYYLTSLYGTDYMQLPQQAQRYTHDIEIVQL